MTREKKWGEQNILELLRDKENREFTKARASLTRTFIFGIVIVFISTGTLQFIDYKFSSPFISSVDIPLSLVETDWKTLENSLDSAVFIDSLGIINVRTFVRRGVDIAIPTSFTNHKGVKSKKFFFRTIETDDKLLKEIFKPFNLVQGTKKEWVNNVKNAKPLNSGTRIYSDLRIYELNLKLCLL